MDKRARPFGVVDPSPGFHEQVLRSALPFKYVFSGEITATNPGIPIGSPVFGGQVEDVILIVGDCGRDDSNALSLEADVTVGGTSVLSTKPKISGKDGAASAARNSLASGEGVVEAIIDQDNNDFTAGQVFMLNLNLTRTATPTTEIANAVVIVEVRPS